MHIHTKYSLCSLNKPRDILKTAIKKKLDGICVVDHNTMKGSLETKKLNKNKNLEVIAGKEIRTNYGDCVVFYHQEDIKETDFLEVVDNVRKQDAFLTIAHPFRLLPYLKFKGDFSKANCIETYNARTFPWENKKAEKEGKELGLASIGGSDAHFPWEIGNGLTIFDDDLRTAIKKRTTYSKGIWVPGFFASMASFTIKKFRTLFS